jgi:tetratricopeptide (TPR) repeat protein
MIPDPALLHAQGRHAEALEVYQLYALDIKTNYRIHYNIAVELRALRRHHEALQSLTTYLRYEPTDFMAWTNAADSLRELGNHQAALVMFREALAHAPDAKSKARAYNNLTRVLWSTGPFDEAYRCAKAAVELDPTEPMYMMSLGELHFIAGEYAKGWVAYDARMAAMAKEALEGPTGDIAEGWRRALGGGTSTQLGAFPLDDKTRQADYAGVASL